MVSDAFEYARDVLSGKIVACSFVKKACERFFYDLETCESRGFYFDEQKAAEAVEFFDLTPHIKGRCAGSELTLSEWQTFIVVNLFGWIKIETGTRRFKTAYIEVARKNGKTTLVAPIGLYMLGSDGEQGAEIYSCATSRDQARLVFDTARDMVRNGELKYHLQAFTHSVVCENKNASFKPLASDSDTLEGKNSHLVLIDELHAHKNRRVYDVMELSLASREQPLLISITTAGDDRTGICYEVRDYATKILDKTIDDDSFFGIIYCIDDPEKWTDSREWIKANPNLGVSVMMDDMERLCKKAQQTPSASSEFKRKRLGVWCEGEKSYYDVEAWRKCPKIVESDLRGMPCFFGLDLSSKLDVTALSMLFSDYENYFLMGRFFLPESVVDSKTSGKAHHIQKMYYDWAKQKHLILTDGKIIDYRFIRKYILEMANLYDPEEIVFDPWGATQLAVQLGEEDGLTMVSVQQSTRNFSESMKEMSALITDNRFYHEHNPMFEWMIGNVQAKVDKNDNVFPLKAVNENKIDGVIAALLAMNRLMAFNADNSSCSDDMIIL